MKKITILFICLLLTAALITGCAPAPAPTPTPPEPEAAALPDLVRVSALKGPTAMGMVKLMRDAEDGTTVNNYEFALTAIDEIVPKISRGEIDIAAVPANLAAVLYQNTSGKIQVLAINTLGVLYVVEKGESINSIADLRGQTLYATGKGATPELALNYVLRGNGLDPAADLTVEYRSEPAEVVPLLAQSTNGIALLPQPFVTAALARVEGLRVALDLTQEWDKVAADDSALLTGVIIVRKDFAAEWPDAVNAFMEEYAASTAYAQTNVAETAELVGQYGIVDASIAAKALPECNITCVAGSEMQSMLSGYLNVLLAQDPQSIGGTMPDEGFYYLP